MKEMDYVAIQPAHSQLWAVHSSYLRLRLLTCLVCLVLALPFAALAQTSAAPLSPAPLPPEAQEALKEGIAATQQQDYVLAIHYFQDARNLAPGAPEIYKELGLAESKIPGHELRAIAWFGADLAANPNTQDVAEAKEQIDALDVKSRGNISHLIQTMHDAASQTGDYQAFELVEIAGLWAEAGDITAAMKAADSIQDAFEKSVALDSIAENQIEAGDIAGALRTNDLIENAYVKSLTQKAIAEAQVTAGDIAGAQKTADLIQDEYWKSEAQKTIADAQARAGSTNNRPALSAITLWDWLDKLDDPYVDGTLEADPFLDLTGYLTSLYTTDPQEDFYTLHDTAEHLIKAQNVIDKMLKQQAGKS